MENSSYKVVRLETLQRRSLGLLGLLCCAVFLGFVCIGLAGPSVKFSVTDESGLYCHSHFGEMSPSCSNQQRCSMATNSILLNGLVHKHQEVTVWAHLMHPSNGSILHQTMQVLFNISSFGEVPHESFDKEKETTTTFEVLRNPEIVAANIDCPTKSFQRAQAVGNEMIVNHTLCDPVHLFSTNFVDHERYRISVEMVIPVDELENPGATSILDSCENDVAGSTRPGFPVIFEMVLVNREYSSWEIGVKMTFLLLSLMANFLFNTRFKKVRQTFTYEQRWIQVLLVALLIFNDPFVALKVFYPSVTLIVISELGTSIFVGIILLFWICVLDNMHKTTATDDLLSKYQHNLCSFYLPKVVIAIFPTLLLFVSQLKSRLPQVKQINSKWALNEPLVHVTSILSFICYLAYLGYLLGLTSVKVRHMSSQFRFLYYLTVFTILTSGIGIATGSLRSIPDSTTDLVVFIGLYNTYTWFMAFAYYPCNIHEKNDECIELQLAIGRFEEEENGTDI